ncbi:hypothetical protein [Novosphingobium sp. 9U]|uniref:hypothetical protein n=1 Tax=Novosphingobium sp. 9U TaxID=2653158 RepID=UPI0012F300E8|nr:hypothetical protein [Novosphingobium sp. 9U]VWX53232.1 hypothetical protein NOVOSPHI9U_420475 [Novosphingobium sp. 9U]
MADFVNSGSVSDDTSQGSYPYFPKGLNIQAAGPLAFANSGTISTPVMLGGNLVTTSNSGSITADTRGVALLITLNQATDGSALSAGLVNSGTISGSSVGMIGVYLPDYWSSQLPDPANISLAITNTATGVIAGKDSGLIVYDAPLTLDNAGTISGGADGMAVMTYADMGHTIRNSGTLVGGVALGGGDDRMENSGTITGPVLLGEGIDTFVHFAGANSGPLVDGGLGTDYFVFQANGDRALSATQITGFEQLTQTGTGTGTYSGTFAVDTIDLQEGTLAVAAGQTLATAGTVAVTDVDSGANVVNRGTITGAFRLGTYNNSCTEYAGSLVTGASMVEPGWTFTEWFSRATTPASVRAPDLSSSRWKAPARWHCPSIRTSSRSHWRART